MNSEKQSRQWAHGADLVVGQLEAQGVKQVFGIPGAKIDKVFDSLLDSSIEIIPVRHEANAAFMAAADYLGKQCRAESFTVGEVTVRQSGGQSAAVMAETLRQTAERLMRPYAASGEFCFRGVRG